MRAIVSVSDKTGLAPFISGLASLQVEIYSTGGTKTVLEQAGVPVKSVSELTNFPEIMDGRIKTLHPAVHGGILARRDLPSHMQQIAKLGIKTIDLVVVNLYPFRQTIARKDVTLEDAIENIDIGGPTMVRSAAKNFHDVIVIVDPADYERILELLRAGEVPLAERRRLAQKAFQHTASYDTAIARYLRAEGDDFPADVTLAMHKSVDLPYGENPHQKASFYIAEDINVASPVSLVSAVQLSGKNLSYNNILDLDAALALITEFEEPTFAIIKHNNPCGVASGEDLAITYQRALAGDPLAAFGGIVACNRTIDLNAAQQINRTHYDAIIAPAFADEAVQLLGRKRDLILVALQEGEAAFKNLLRRPVEYRQVAGGFLAQTADFIHKEELGGDIVSRREPTSDEWRDLLFAWRTMPYVKSNSIVLTRDSSILGVGPGQPSRVASVEIALERAGTNARGSCLASDGFFPFTDGVEMAAKAGIAAIIQPGGSVKDEEIIEVANNYGMAMVFTGVRHFKH